jgi:hypothetical protein
MQTFDPNTFEPTLASTNRLLEEYAEETGAVGPALPPLDAFLLHAFLGMCPTRPVVVDRMAARTHGRSALLCLTHPRVQRLVVPAGAAWLHDVQQFLDGREGPKRTSLSTASPENMAQGAGPAPVVLLETEDKSGAALLAELDAIRRSAAGAVFVVFGIGRVGACDLVPVLLGHCASSGLSLELVREASDFFGGSGLVLVYPKSAGFVPDVLKRIGRWFTGTFDYLDLVQTACRDAIQTAGVDHAAYQSRGASWFDPYEEQITILRRQLTEKEAELADIRAGLLWRLHHSCAKGLHAVKRGAHVLRHEGLWSLCRKAIARIRRRLRR